MDQSGTFLSNGDVTGSGSPLAIGERLCGYMLELEEAPWYKYWYSWRIYDLPMVCWYPGEVVLKLYPFWSNMWKDLQRWEVSKVSVAKIRICGTSFGTYCCKFKTAVNNNCLKIDWYLTTFDHPSKIVIGSWMTGKCIQVADSAQSQDTGQQWMPWRWSFQVPRASFCGLGGAQDSVSHWTAHIPRILLLLDQAHLWTGPRWPPPVSSRHETVRWLQQHIYSENLNLHPNHIQKVREKLGQARLQTSQVPVPKCDVYLAAECFGLLQTIIWSFHSG